MTSLLGDSHDLALSDGGRLAALHETGLVDAQLAEPEFERLARLTARALQAPMALIALVTADRQVTLGTFGLSQPHDRGAAGSPLSHSMCRYVVASGAPVVVPDVLTDPLYGNHPGLAELGASTYLGVPLVDAAGHVLGAVCVMDTVARTWSDELVETLGDLAAQAVREIELRAEVTRRGQLLSAIESERARNLELFALAPAFICFLGGPHHVFEFANARYYQLVGHRPLIGRSVREALPEVEGQGLVALLDNVLATGQPHLAERMRVRFERTAGAAPEERAVTFVYQPIVDPAGVCSGVFVLGVDATDEVRAHEQLVRHDALLTETQRMSSIGSWAFDARTGVATWSEEMYRLHAVDSDTAPETIDAYTEFVHADDRAAIRAALAHTLATGEPFMQDYRIVRSDGTTRSVHGHGRLECDAAGHMLRMVGSCQDVTDRVRTLGALRRSEERYRLSSAATRDVIYDYDVAEGTVHHTGSEGAVLGYGTGDLEPTLAAWRALVHPEDRERVNAMLRAALESPATTVFACEYRMRRRDGSDATVADRGAIVRDAQGAACRVVGAIADFTEQREAEEALRESEARFRGLVEAAHEGVWALDASARTTYVNPRMAEMLGYTADEMLGREFFDFMEPPAVAEAQALFARRESGVAESHEFTFRRADGTAMQAALSASPLQLAGDSLPGALALVSDVSERWRAEAALRESEARLRLALSVAGMVVWERDLATDRVRYGVLPATDADASPAADKVRDYAHFLATVHTDDRERVARTNAEAVARRGEFSIEYRVVGAPGAARWHQAAARVIDGPDGRPARVVGVSLDVTERRMLEAQLRQAQRMEAVGRLAGGIAHDFNNLLTVVAASTMFARAELPPRSPAVIELDQIDEASRRAADLTRQLLAFSRKQVLRPQRVDVNQHVAGLELLLRRVIGEDVRIETRLAVPVWPVYADPGQLEQVLMNLVVNARDAMPAGGVVRITTQNVEVDARMAQSMPELTPGSYVSLEVTDSGVGIPADLLPHIFEPFVTTKPPGKGTGLGLPMVYGIVKQSGGYVDVRSTPDQGTTFTVLLPRDVDDAPPADLATAAPPPAGGRETVLLVEDEVAVRSALARVLARHGYRVLEAADGEEALRVWHAHGGQATRASTLDPGPDAPTSGIDIVLTDLVMPVLGGRLLVERLRLEAPDTRIIIMTGYTADTAGVQALIASDVRSAFLQKPIGPNDLLRAVRHVLEEPHAGR